MNYTIETPSARYKELLSLYQEMHENPDMFSGLSLLPHIQRISKLIKFFNAKSLLDYGSGKGIPYQDGCLEKQWGFKPTLYEPAYLPYSKRPNGKFDGVISTDVLEHIPEEDIDWFLDDLFGYATKFVYFNIACFSAAKNLPDGSNAHATIKSRFWWAKKVRKANARYPKVKCIYFCYYNNPLWRRIINKIFGIPGGEVIF